MPSSFTSRAMWQFMENHARSSYADRKMLEKIIKKASKRDIVDNGLLFDAVMFRKPWIVDAVLNRIKSLRIPHSESGIDRIMYGLFVRWKAASYDFAILKMLLRNGANPNIISNSGSTPLSTLLLATKKRHAIEELSILLKYGLNPRVPITENLSRKTPIDYLISVGRMFEAAMLYKAGAEPSSRYWCKFVKYLKTKKSKVDYPALLRWCKKHPSYRWVSMDCPGGSEFKCERISDLRSLALSKVMTDSTLKSQSSALPSVMTRWTTLPDNAYTEFSGQSAKRKRESIY